jgi:hypothetical protein
MTTTAEYSADVLAVYRSLVIGDPYSDADEDDAAQARTVARVDAVAGTRPTCTPRSRPPKSVSGSAPGTHHRKDPTAR